MLTRSCVAVQSFIKPHARKLIAMILSMFSMFKRLALRSQRQCENRFENEPQTPLKTHRLDGLLESLAKGLIMTGQNLNASKKYRIRSWAGINCGQYFRNNPFRHLGRKLSAVGLSKRRNFLQSASRSCGFRTIGGLCASGRIMSWKVYRF